MEKMDDVEEMLREMSEKYKNSKSVEVYEEQLEGWFKIIDDLREENKSLKANVEFLHQCLDDRDKSIQYAEEENKKLNIKVASLEGEIKGLNSVIDKLKEENQTLELWLDNKEKLNEEYRRQIDKLKSDLGECECSFGFESDEVGYRKREYKRLKKWIKDHCKGYGNLFPEDEMKRQRKKADKKRKKTKEEEELSKLKEKYGDIDY